MSLPLATSTWDNEEYAAIQRVIDSDRFGVPPAAADADDAA